MINYNKDHNTNKCVRDDECSKCFKHCCELSDGLTGATGENWNYWCNRSHSARDW